MSVVCVGVVCDVLHAVCVYTGGDTVDAVC